jgi:hypothetical protein
MARHDTDPVLQQLVHAINESGRAAGCAMRRRVREHAVARWAASFLDTLNDKARPGGHSVLVLGKEEGFAGTHAATG